MKKSDISILVVEKNLNPLTEGGNAMHDFSDIAFMLDSEGYNVDFVWSLSEYDIGDIKLAGRRLKSRLEDMYDLPRKTQPTMDDLQKYDFLILHPSVKDNGEVLPEIEKTSQTVIIPMEYCVNYRCEDIPVENVIKDNTRETYGVSEFEFNKRTSKLLEYLIERKS